jgi:hypothetical protein
MSTGNLSEVKVWPELKVDNLTAICKPIVQKNVRDSTSHNPMDLHGLSPGPLSKELLASLFGVLSQDFLGWTEGTVRIASLWVVI